MPHLNRAARAAGAQSQPGRRDAPTADASIPSLDIQAALGGLDRAARNFTRRLGETEAEPARPARTPTPPSAPQAGRADAGSRRPPRAPAPQIPARSTSQESAERAFEARLREAEREAREYLEQAKQRADTIVATMVGAVEREAAEIRREAEDGIRARWQQVEADASRHIEEARRVGDGMVAERQERLAALSDAITRRAVTLSIGLDDADRVREQFEVFVRALSVTAGQIAADRDGGRAARAASAGVGRDLHGPARPDSLAA